MQYAISFLEGIITFISPCLLPMLPLYISYFANGENNRRKTMINALGFILGFTLIFVTLGFFAGTLGSVLMRHQRIIELVTGLVVVILGLNFMSVIQIPFLNRTIKMGRTVKSTGFLTSVLFGIVFSVGWTPCVGTFLGSALMLASQRGTALEGVLMLLVYSAGMGIPFFLSALLLDQLKVAFSFIKKNYGVINKVCGVFLVVMGIAMMSGVFGRFLRLFSV